MTGAALTGLYLWKAKDIRSVLSMTGEGWNKLDPVVQEKAANVLHDANKLFKPQGLSVGIFEGYRTKARQRDVMASGNSEVSDPYRSYHTWGLAVDFVFLSQLGGWTWEPYPGQTCDWYNVFCSDPNRTAWESLGEVIKSHGFEWGGDWKTFDGPHAQYTGYGRTSNLLSEFKDPEKFILRSA